MENRFPYSDNNKRYHTVDYFYKHTFHRKVAKVSLNGGFTCPNRDGTTGIGGCTFCSKLGSGEYAGNPKEPLLEQFQTIQQEMKKKWSDALWIGYFQANSNTYDSVSHLKEKYEIILDQKDVIGLAIATRPDAISKETLDYLEELSHRTYLTVELGLQTIHAKTAQAINRCHSLDCFTKMVQELRKRNIPVVVHLINGLPGESKSDMIASAQFLNNLDIQGVKIHMLQVLKDTVLGEQYQQNPFPLLTKDEYIDIVIDQLRCLRPEIVIHRLTGDPKKEDLLAPEWVLNKTVVLNDIDKEMVKWNCYQGDFVNKKNISSKQLPKNKNYAIM